MKSTDLIPGEIYKATREYPNRAKFLVLFTGSLDNCKNLENDSDRAHKYGKFTINIYEWIPATTEEVERFNRAFNTKIQPKSESYPIFN